MKGSPTMKTATSLTLIAVGAIIAFAITAHVAFLNLQVTGWVFILDRSRRRHHHPQQLAAPHPGSERPPRRRCGRRHQPAPAAVTAPRARQAARGSPRCHAGRARDHRGIRRRLTTRPDLQCRTPEN